MYFHDVLTFFCCNLFEIVPFVHIHIHVYVLFDCLIYLTFDFFIFFYFLKRCLPRCMGMSYLFYSDCVCLWSTPKKRLTTETTLCMFISRGFHPYMYTLCAYTLYLFNLRMFSFAFTQNHLLVLCSRNILSLSLSLLMYIMYVTVSLYMYTVYTHCTHRKACKAKP